MSYIAENPNLTFDILEKNIAVPWNWFYVSSNKFNREKELFYEKYYRIYMATFRLQQYFNTAYDNPRYKFCRDRFERNWDAIVNE